MKKLMVMIGAVAAAFGLYATDFTHTIDFSTDFPDGQYDLSENTGTEGLYWSYNGTNKTDFTMSDDLLVVADEDVLKIGTGSKVLKRTFVDCTSAISPLAIGEGLYFDGTIDFMNQVSTDLSTDFTGAKLGLIILDNSDLVEGTAVAPSTNLYVIAGYGETGKALYKIQKVDAQFLANPHRVTIKAYSDILTTNDRGGFLVFLDAQDTGTATAASVSSVYALTTEGVDWSTDLYAADYAGLTSYDSVIGSLKAWYTKKSIFVSLAEGSLSQSLTSVDFTGNAKISKLTLQNMPFDFLPGDSEVITIDPNGLTYTATLAGELVTPENNQIFGAAGQAVVLTITSDVSGKIVKAVSSLETAVTVNDAVVSFSFVNNDEITITAQDPAVTVDVDGVAKSYATFEEALAGLPETFTSAKFTLNQNVDLVYDDELTTGGYAEFTTGDITIDLAGKTLTGTGNEAMDISAVIYNQGANLSITNSTGSGSVAPAQGTTDVAAVETAAGTTAITAGQFDGAIVDDTANTTLTGGTFLQEVNERSTLEGFLPVEGGYEVSGEDTDDYLTVRVAQAKKGTVIFICEKTDFEATSNDVAAATLISTIVPSKDAVANGTFYTAGDWYTDQACTIPLGDAAVVADETTMVYAKAGIEFTKEGEINLIQNETDMLKFKAAVEDGTYLDASFKVTADITIANKYSVCTKDNATSFAGTFDGADHTITFTSQEYKPDTAKTRFWTGLFTGLGDGVVIKNLTVNGTVGADDADLGDSYSAILATYTYGSATFENVTVKGTGRSKKNLAAFVCYPDLRPAAVDRQLLFKNCTNEATLTSVAGLESSKLAAFVNYGVAPSAAGDLSSIVFDNCVNDAPLTLNAEDKAVYFGAFVGGFDGNSKVNFVFNNCENTEKGVMTLNYNGRDNGVAGVGTFIGRKDASTDSFVNFTNVVARGAINITVTGDNTASTLYAGGLIGVFGAPAQNGTVNINGAEVACAINVTGADEDAYGFVAIKVKNIAVEGTLKAPAAYKAYADNCDGLNFATVADDVATYVADNALDTNNTYKVMVGGATATYAFEAPGVLTFVTNMCEAVFAVTAADTLDLTETPSADGVTFTAVAAGPAPIDPTNPSEPMDEDAAKDAAKAINDNPADYIKVPADFEGKVTGDALTAYQGYFTAVVVPSAEAGKFEVVLELNQAGSNKVVAAEQAADTTVLTTVLEATDDSTEVTVPTAAVIPGFYYSMKQGAALQSIDFAQGTDANKKGGVEALTFQLQKPENSGFYQMLITPKPVDVPDPE